MAQTSDQSVRVDAADPVVAGQVDVALVAGVVAAERARVAERLNAVVVRMIFAAGLDLAAARQILHDAAPESHEVDERLDRAVATLDDAVRELRSIVLPPEDLPA